MNQNNGKKFAVRHRESKKKDLFSNKNLEKGFGGLVNLLEGKGGKVDSRTRQLVVEQIDSSPYLRMLLFMDD